MAQYNLNLDPETLLGTEMISQLNLWAAAVKGLHSGASRPAYLTAGALWVDSSAAGFLTLKLFDGASDVSLATVTAATHALALAAHSHIIGDVTGLQAALDGKSATGHGHAQADITGLVAALAGKSATGHGHAIGDVTGLEDALAAAGGAESFTSAPQPITAGGLLTLAHGLSAAPSLVSLRLKCIDAGGELDWLQNDEVLMPVGSPDSSANRGTAVHVDSSNVNLRFGNTSQTFSILRKSDGARPASLTNSKWNLIVDAWVIA